ncbi:MAG: sigma-70 family RNA polymerase sigma factor [Pirellulales bacterium]|nr:sigma-70 family RNA polymerase sigma factor [Pirellulales bacterium]
MNLPVNKVVLDRLVREHLPATLRFATRLTGDPEQAEEIVQESLMRVVGGWRSLRDVVSFRAWLWQIVMNVFRDHMRRVRDISLLPDSLPDQGAGDPFRHAVENELQCAVADHIARLPDRQREVLVLMTYEQFSPEEVSKMLGISTANVYTTLHMARKKLRMALAQYLPTK